MADEKPKKSNLPNLNEITGMASKLFNDVKKSVSEIINDYKEKRVKDTPEQASGTATTAETKPETSDTQSNKKEKSGQEDKPNDS